MIRGILITVLATFLAQPLAAQLVVDDFLSGEFSVQVEPGEDWTDSQDLTGVTATRRGTGVSDNGRGVTSIAVDNGVFSFETAGGAESFPIFWDVTPIDVTNPSTSLLELNFSEFDIPDQYLDGDWSVGIRDGEPMNYRNIARIPYQDLYGGGTAFINLNQQPQDVVLDLTSIQLIGTSTIDADPGLSFELSSVRVIPEPSGLALMSVSLVCLFHPRRTSKTIPFGRTATGTVTGTSPRLTW